MLYLPKGQRDLKQKGYSKCQQDRTEGARRRLGELRVRSLRPSLAAQDGGTARVPAQGEHGLNLVAGHRSKPSEGVGGSMD